MQFFVREWTVTIIRPTRDSKRLRQMYPGGVGVRQLRIEYFYRRKMNEYFQTPIKIAIKELLLRI